MGGVKKISLQRPWENAVNGPVGDILLSAGQKPAESGHAGIYQRTEMVITTLVGQIIGRKIFLHTLLGSADFSDQYTEKGKSASQPKRWNLRGEPFQIAFFSHALHYDCQYLTIVSKGRLKAFDGRKTDLWMELSLERIGVSPASTAMQWEQNGMPLVVNFDAGPENLSETAFSFDTDQENDVFGCSYSGCGFLAIINHKAGITEYRHQSEEMLPYTGICR